MTRCFLNDTCSKHFISLKNFQWKGWWKFSDVLQEGVFIVMDLDDCKAELSRILQITNAYLCTSQPNRTACDVNIFFQLRPLRSHRVNVMHKFYVGPGLYVKADCTQYHLFISTKHPPLTPFMKQCNIWYLWINYICEYKPPYMQSTITCNLGTTRNGSHS